MAADGHGEVVIASGLINDGMMGWTLAKQTLSVNHGWNGIADGMDGRGWPRNIHHCDRFNK